MDLVDYGLIVCMAGAAAILSYCLIVRLINHFWGPKAEIDQYLKRISDSLK